MSVVAPTTSSVVNNKNLIKYGDEVIIWFGYTEPMKPLIVTFGSEYATKDGFWPHDRFVNKEFGSRIVGRHRNNKDAAVVPPPILTVLRNTPELWSQALPHRTQIIVQTDISVIIANLGLKPGKIIVEAGTGSGSLTHSLARAVAPKGTVYTFDFHKVRALTAQKEFARHGLSKVVKSGWRDVCAKKGQNGVGGDNDNDYDEADLERTPTSLDEQEALLPGYGLPSESVDAAFLDVPCPWDAVPHVIKVLRRGTGMVCSYSPCIEQTQKFCEALRRSEQFHDIHTVEALAHEHTPTFVTKKDKEAGVRRLRDLIEEITDEGLNPEKAKEKKISNSSLIAGQAPKDDDDAEGENSNDENEGPREPENDAKNGSNNNAWAPSERTKGFAPHHFGRGHTAYLTFAQRRLK